MAEYVPIKSNDCTFSSVGYVGTSGVKISDPNVVNNRARIWC